MHIDRFGAVQRLLFDPAQANYLEDSMHGVSRYTTAEPLQSCPGFCGTKLLCASWWERNCQCDRNPVGLGLLLFPPASELLRPAKEPRIAFPASADQKPTVIQTDCAAVFSPMAQNPGPVTVSDSVQYPVSTPKRPLLLMLASPPRRCCTPVVRGFGLL